MSTIGEQVPAQAPTRASGDLSVRDLVAIGLLASPGFVLPPLVGPTFETVGLTAMTTLAAAGWALSSARRGRRR